MLVTHRPCEVNCDRERSPVAASVRLQAAAAARAAAATAAVVRVLRALDAKVIYALACVFS
jgi:hypothetical protein